MARKGDRMKTIKMCARCGKHLRADPQHRLFSVHTRLYYCPDVDECGRRAKRAKKAAA